MGIRKIQRSGNSSFVVSLPIEWVKLYGLKKRDLVDIQVNQDGSITIFPFVEKKHIIDEGVLYIVKP